MATTEIPRLRVMSDLVLNETAKAIGLARQSINVTPPANNGKIKLGTVVFRAKSLDLESPYTVLTSATELSTDNEYAVVFGDNFSTEDGFVPKAIVAGKFNAVGFVKGYIQLKDYFLKQDLASFTSAQFNQLISLLRIQDILVAPTF